MKNFLIFILFIVVLISFASHSAGAGETILLSTGEWQPYISRQSDHYGPYSRIITRAFALEGIAVEYKFFPWKRSIHAVKTGSVDGCVAAVHTPERKQLFLFSSRPVMVTDRVFFHLKSDPFDWQDIDSLKGTRIGATLVYYYGDAFEDAEKKGMITVARSSSDTLNMRMLVKGRIRIFPVSKDVGYHILRSEFPPEISRLVTHHPRKLSSSSFHLVLLKNRENERLMQSFDRGFKRLQQSGEYDTILAPIK